MCFVPTHGHGHLQGERHPRIRSATKELMDKKKNLIWGFFATKHGKKTDVRGKKTSDRINVNESMYNVFTDI